MRRPGRKRHFRGGGWNRYVGGSHGTRCMLAVFRELIGRAMRTLLVTGGAGFIGSAFVRHALDQSPSLRVIMLDKLTYAGHLANLDEVQANPRYTFVQGDIGDVPLVTALLADFRPQAIINLAAETHVDRSIDGPAPFVSTNVVGVCTMLEAAVRHWLGLPADERTVFRFLHVSTDEVYGSLGRSGSFSEESPYAPNSPYAASKAAGDHFLRAYHATYGLPTLLTNCSNNYGPRQFPEKLLPLMTLNALAGRPLPIYGDGLQVRDWLYVDDHCAGLWQVLQQAQPGAHYNLGGNCERTNLEIVSLLCDLLDEESPSADGPRRRLITHVADRPGHDRRYAIDCGKIERELDWRPSTSLADGLRATLRWYLAHPEWIDAVAGRRYAGERQGLGAATENRTK